MLVAEPHFYNPKATYFAAFQCLPATIMQQSTIIEAAHLCTQRVMGHHHRTMAQHNSATRSQTTTLQSRPVTQQ
jgi:hypothetical protein